jgi:hypothetical protein
MGSCQTVPVNESADPRRVGTDPDGVKFIAVSFSRWPPPAVLRTQRKYTLGHVVLKYDRLSRFVIGKALNTEARAISLASFVPFNHARKGLRIGSVLQHLAAKE